MSENKFRLGQVLKDSVTGLEGVAISRIEYLNGCTRFALQPKGTKEDGGIMDSTWVDDQQLSVVEDAPTPEDDQVSRGGPGVTPPKENAPTR